mmetsp:Transcript_62569/g.149689  ORF Transcript_62569/g.149689 Transcript_62569/m.149689 type:complete len:236 (-) Transcript_62569:82-789(-)
MASVRTMILAVAAVPAALAFSPGLLGGCVPALRHASVCSVTPGRRLAQALRCKATSDITSPFTEGAEAAGVRMEEAEETPFTIEAVDKVLDQVRPYLIADGGNCKVMEVDAATGDISLMLEGACGTCPSSTVTLKMGIERALREVYGARLGQVIPVTGAGPDALTVDACNALVDPVRAAVKGLGGIMQILSADEATGTVTIEYAGPEKLTYGIELTLLDHPLVNKVEFVAPSGVP